MTRWGCGVLMVIESNAQVLSGFSFASVGFQLFAIFG
jgi:hypothetical protein